MLEPDPCVLPGFNEFNFRLLRSFDPLEQPFFSSYSIAMALTLLLPGAKGQTKEEIATLLGLNEPWEKSLKRFLQMDECLIDRSATGNAFSFRSANGLFIDQDGPVIEEAYLSQVKEELRGTARSMRFSKTEDTTRAINQWVSTQTRERIKNLLSPDDIRDAVMVLVNAVHFKAKWVVPFNKYNTQAQNFHCMDGQVRSVEMMAFLRAISSRRPCSHCSR